MTKQTIFRDKFMSMICSQAHQELEQVWKTLGRDPSDMEIEERGEIHYTDLAQDIFNQHYDELEGSMLEQYDPVEEKHFMVTIVTQDGEYEYRDSSIVTMCDAAISDGDVLAMHFMQPLIYDEYTGGYQIQGDYRLYRLGGMKEISTSDLDVLRSYIA